MEIATLGQALDLGWQLRVKCGWGKRDGMKSIRECIWSIDIDMPTLVATCGRECSLDLLGRLFRCPQCGSRRVRTFFEVPPIEDRKRMRA